MVNRTKLFLIMVACVSMNMGMLASRPQEVVENLWPDGRECFQDLAEPKIESQVKVRDLSPQAGEILVAGARVNPQALLLADRLKQRGPQRLRSIIDDAPSAFKSIPNEIWQKYICPAASHDAQFPIQISAQKNEELFWKSKNGSLKLIYKEGLVQLINQETKKVLLTKVGTARNTFAFSPDDRFVAFCDDGRMKVLELPSLNERVNRPIPHNECGKFSNNSEFLITQLGSNTEIIDLRNPSDPWKLQGKIVVSPDGASLFKFVDSDQLDCSIEKFDIATRKQQYVKKHVKTFEHGVSRLGISAQGNYIAALTQWNPQSVNQTFGVTYIFDATTGDPVFGVLGNVEFYGEYFVARRIVSTLYRLSDQKEMFKQIHASDYIYCSNDGQFQVIINSACTTLFDISSKQTTTFDGESFVFSPDSKYLAFRTILRSLWGNVCKSTINIVYLKTKKVCAHIQMPSNYLVNRRLEFSSSEPMLKIPCDEWGIDAVPDLLVDLSILEDPAIKRIINDELTLEQFMLLGYLVDIKQKNNNSSISLLADIATPRALRLSELQTVLASFPSEIQEAIMKNFNIVDATEKDALEQKAKREKYKQWIASVKKMGTASVVAAAAVVTAWLMCSF